MSEIGEKFHTSQPAYDATGRRAIRQRVGAVVPCLALGMYLSDHSALWRCLAVLGEVHPPADEEDEPGEAYGTVSCGSRYQHRIGKDRHVFSELQRPDVVGGDRCGRLLRC